MASFCIEENIAKPTNLKTRKWFRLNRTVSSRDASEEKQDNGMTNEYKVHRGVPLKVFKSCQPRVRFVIAMSSFNCLSVQEIINFFLTFGCLIVHDIFYYLAVYFAGIRVSPK